MLKIRSLINTLKMQDKSIDVLIQELIEDTKDANDCSDISAEFKSILGQMFQQIEQLKKDDHFHKNEEIITLWVGGIIWALAFEDEKKISSAFFCGEETEAQELIKNRLYPLSLNKLYKQFREETNYNLDHDEDNPKNNEAVKATGINFMNWLGRKALTDDIPFITDFQKVRIIPTSYFGSKNQMRIFDRLSTNLSKIEKVILSVKPIIKTNFFPKYVSAYVKGAALGLFFKSPTKPSLLPDIVNFIANNYLDKKDAKNMVLTSKAVLKSAEENLKQTISNDSKEVVNYAEPSSGQCMTM